MNRGRQRRRRQFARSISRQPLAPPRMAPSDHVAHGIKPALDTLLDALTYGRSGSWESLKQMAAALHEDPMFAWTAAKTLSGLGHLEIRMDAQTFRLVSWQIAPSTLVQTGDGSWVLAGARSDALVDRLDSVLEGRLSYEDQEGAPTVLRTPPMSVADAQAVAGAVASPLGGNAFVSPDFARRVSSILVPLCSVIPQLAVARMPSRGHEQFDLQSGRWQAAPDLPRAGAYRINLHGRLYGIATADDARNGIMHVVDAPSAKHMAASARGVSLIGYDRVARTIIAPMGAELPGLLHRVAALASGSPPQLHRQAGMIIYRDVGEDVAAHIQRCLGIAC